MLKFQTIILAFHNHYDMLVDSRREHNNNGADNDNDNRNANLIPQS